MDEDYVMYCEAMQETKDKPLSYDEWKKVDKDKHEND